MEKLKSLQSACSGLKYIEVNLFSPEGESDDNKTALFKIISDEKNLAEYSRSKRWEDAFLNAFDKIKDQITRR
jgi:hypothetical protein